MARTAVRSKPNGESLRKIERPDKPGERLFDRTIRHGLYFERLKNRLVRDLIGRLNRDLFPRIAALVDARLAAVDGGGVRLSTRDVDRLDALFVRVAEITAEQMAGAAVAATTSLEDTGRDEHLFWVGALSLALGKARRDRAASIDARRLRQIVAERPFLGASLREHFDRAGESLARSVRRETLEGTSRGESAAQIVRRLRGVRTDTGDGGVFDGARRATDAVMRAAAEAVASGARTEAFDAEPEIVAEQWVATLDTRTCPRCAALDGQRFEIDEGPRPPAHGSCRCKMAPIVEGEEPPEPITFGAWLRSQTAEVQDDALGPTRGALFRRGGLEVRDFVDQRGKTLTLKQLRQRERDAFERAGIEDIDSSD